MVRPSSSLFVTEDLTRNHPSFIIRTELNTAMGVEILRCLRMIGLSVLGEKGMLPVVKAGFFYLTIFIYLYTVGLLSPHTLASSLTFIFPSTNAG